MVVVVVVVLVLRTYIRLIYISTHTLVPTLRPFSEVSSQTF